MMKQKFPAGLGAAVFIMSLSMLACGHDDSQTLGSRKAKKPKEITIEGKTIDEKSCLVSSTSKDIKLDQEHGQLSFLTMKFPKNATATSGIKGESDLTPTLKVSCTWKTKDSTEAKSTNLALRIPTTISFMVPWSTEPKQSRTFVFGDMKQIHQEIREGKYRPDETGTVSVFVRSADNQPLALQVQEGSATWQPSGARGSWEWNFKGILRENQLGILPMGPKGPLVFGPQGVGGKDEKKKSTPLPVAEPGSALDLAGKKQK